MTSDVLKIVYEIANKYRQECDYSINLQNRSTSDVAISYPGENITIDIYSRRTGWRGIPKELKGPMAKIVFKNYLSNQEYNASQKIDSSLLLNWIIEPTSPRDKSVYVREEHLAEVLPIILHARH